MTILKSDINSMAIAFLINEDNRIHDLIADSQYERTKQELFAESEKQFGTPDHILSFMAVKGVNKALDIRFTYPGGSRFDAVFVQRITEILRLMGAEIETIDKGFVSAKSKNNKRLAFVVNKEHLFNTFNYKNNVGFPYIYPTSLADVKAAWEKIVSS